MKRKPTLGARLRYENEYLSAIFDDLLDEKGSEIYMRPAADYVTTDKPVTFYTVAEAAWRGGDRLPPHARGPG